MHCSVAESAARSRGPNPRQGFGLLEYELRGFLLLIGRVPVLAQDPLDENAEVRTHVLANSPVDRDVGPDLLGELPGDRQEFGFAEDGDRTVIRLEGIVEGELVV